MKKEKIIIILVGFLDVLGISMILPTLPDLAKYYDVTDHIIAYGITAYALFAFLTAPILWQLSDVFGRKKILLLCIVGSFLSSLTIVFSTTFLFFIIGRIINGVTGGNISVLQAIIQDISKTKVEKMANMGMLGAMFGSAFIFGPLIWWILLHFHVMAPYIFMTIVSGIEIFILIFFLSETNKTPIPRKIHFYPFALIWKYFRKEWLNLFLFSFFFIFLSFSTYQAILSLYLSQIYQVSGSFSGYVYAIFWVIIIINQGFFLKRFWLKKFSLPQLLYLINFWVFFAYVLLSILQPLYLFLWAFFILIPFQSILNPVYQTEIIEHAKKNERGEIAGVISSMTSMSMFLGPLLWGFLLERNINIFIASACLIFISICIVFYINKKIISA